MTTKNFKVIRASAGTGKTYTLVQEYLQLALKNGTPWYYKHILAITFTNAAAAEMKERILNSLRLFTQAGNSGDLLHDIAQNLQLTEDELRTRAGEVFHHMLHNYGQLSILTIDSFTSKLIRSFSKDLHLNYDFKIEMDTTAFMEKVVDECISMIGEDESLTTWLVGYARRNAEDESDWNFRNKLLETAKEMLRETAMPALEKLSTLSDVDFLRIANEVHKANADLESKAATLARKGLHVLSQANLSVQDFPHGKSSGLSFFVKVADDNIIETAKKRTLDYLELENAWYTKKAAPELISRVLQIQDPIREILSELVSLLSEKTVMEYKIRKAIHKNIYAIGLINKLKVLADQIRTEENIILIADFHKMVNDIVRNNHAPFIFERIGVRYRHIMIDEFQDTSVLQWENALPLIDNALAENHMNLIVGDAKQAIYRWRGGDARQFVNLPELRPESASQITSLPHHFHRENLTTSYRSATSIVDFNNMLYQKLIEDNPILQPVYDGFQQNAQSNLKGMVKVLVTEGNNKKEARPFTLEAILQMVREALEDGYQPGDIAILTRKGKGEADEIAAMLMNSGYQVVTKESLLADQSTTVNVVISYLNMLFVPSDKFAPTLLIQSLMRLHPQFSITSFREKYAVGSGKKLSFDVRQFIEDHFANGETLSLSTPPIESIMTIMRKFKLDPDSGLEFLLEKVKAHCIDGHFTITEFLQWWKDHRDKTYTTSIGSADAIQIMTVHKSKGLEFPVVIYARMTTAPKKDDIWLNLDEEKFGLPATLMTYSNKFADDSEQEEFGEETEQKQIDELNICYVATTRPKDRLYLILEGGMQGALTKQIISEIQKTSATFPESAFVMGERDKNTRQPKQDNSIIIPFDHAPVHTWRIRSKSNNNSQAVVYGEILHLCLQQMQTEKDGQQAVRTVLENSIHRHLESQLLTDIQNIIQHPTAKKWFNGEGRVITEHEIVTAEGKILRPDRVVVFENFLDVIDYKTGIPAAHHAEQVKSYMQEISQIEELPARGFVVYTTTGEIIEVTQTH